MYIRHLQKRIDYISYSLQGYPYTQGDRKDIDVNVSKIAWTDLQINIIPFYKSSYLCVLLTFYYICFAVLLPKWIWIHICYYALTYPLVISIMLKGNCHKILQENKKTKKYSGTFPKSTKHLGSYFPESLSCVTIIKSGRWTDWLLFFNTSTAEAPEKRKADAWKYHAIESALPLY